MQFSAPFLCQSFPSQLLVEWTHEISTVQEYEIQYCKVFFGSWQSITVPSVNVQALASALDVQKVANTDKGSVHCKYLISGLQPSTRYRVRVRCRMSSTIWSDYSPKSSALLTLEENKTCSNNNGGGQSDMARVVSVGNDKTQSENVVANKSSVAATQSAISKAIATATAALRQQNEAVGAAVVAETTARAAAEKVVRAMQAQLADQQEDEAKMREMYEQKLAAQASRYEEAVQRCKELEEMLGKFQRRSAVEEIMKAEEAVKKQKRNDVCDETAGKALAEAKNEWKRAIAEAENRVKFLENELRQKDEAVASSKRDLVHARLSWQTMKANMNKRCARWRLRAETAESMLRLRENVSVVSEMKQMEVEDRLSQNLELIELNTTLCSLLGACGTKAKSIRDSRGKAVVSLVNKKLDGVSNIKVTETDINETNKTFLDTNCATNMHDENESRKVSDRYRSRSFRADSNGVLYSGWLTKLAVSSRRNWRRRFFRLRIGLSRKSNLLQEEENNNKGEKISNRKTCSTRFAKNWRVLDPGRVELQYYVDDKPDKTAKPRGRLLLLRNASLKQTNVGNRKNCLQLAHAGGHSDNGDNPAGIFYAEAETAIDLHRWMRALYQALDCENDCKESNSENDSSSLNGAISVLDTEAYKEIIGSKWLPQTVWAIPPLNSCNYNVT
eukprot:g1633.t1